jgi:RND family efflux transporter MFP subunit
MIDSMLKKLIEIAIVVGIFLGTSVTVNAESYYEIRVHDLSPPVTLSGTVIPEKEVTLSAQLPGRVNEIAGEEGDAFKENDVLVAIDDSQLLAQRRSAYAQWQQAGLALRNAGIQYERERWSPQSPSEHTLGGMGLPGIFDQFISNPLSEMLGQRDEGLDRRTQLHSYGTRIGKARAALSQAEAKIEQIDSKLRDAQSFAPFEGIIIQKWVEVGDTVQPGKPLLKFADISNLQIEVDVPARLVRGLKVGKRVSAKLDVLDERAIVKVAQIFPIADPQRHTVKVKFDLFIDEDREDGRYVGPGQYAQVDVPDVRAGKQELLLIPKTAIVKGGGSLPGVCVLRADNKHERRMVRLGRAVNPALISELDSTLGDYVTVLSGLKAGDKVVMMMRGGKTPC